MEYKKHKLEHYNLHIIKTNKFKTISIRINLKNKLNKENVIERIILSKILILINSIYKDERELKEEIQNIEIELKNEAFANFYDLVQTQQIEFIGNGEK